MPVTPVYPGVPRVSVYTEDRGYISRTKGPQVIAAFWADGRVVWSADPLEGGIPYRKGRVDPRRLRELLDRLDRQGTFGDAELERPYFGPDTVYTVLAVADGKRRLTMRSWHELMEAGGAVATHSGVEPLDGRKLDEVLAAEPQEYQRFRKTWAEIRSALAALVPSKATAAPRLKFEARPVGTDAPRTPRPDRRTKKAPRLRTESEASHGSGSRGQ
jgi:hypothetical protein